MTKNCSRVTRRELFGLLAFSITAANCKQTFPKPQYQLGQWVKRYCFIDDPLNSRDGQRTYCLGYVVGFVWECPEWRSESLKLGWTYWIRWLVDYGETCDPFTDYEHESELVLESNILGVDQDARDSTKAHLKRCFGSIVTQYF